MATVNITADMNQEEAVLIADGTAEAGTHLFQFFNDGKNVFNIATQDISLDAVDAVTVIDDTSYGFNISAEQAQLLDGAVCSYKHYLLSNEGAKTLKNEGSVTVTGLTGVTPVLLEPFVNGDNFKTVNGTEYYIQANDDTLYLNPTVGVVMDVYLPLATIMPGKRFELKLIGAGDADIQVAETTHQIILLDTTGETCLIRSAGADEDDWKTFYQ